MNGSRLTVAVALVVTCAALRLAAIQIPMLGVEGGVNFAPIGALAMFCGFIFRDARLAFGLPLGATLLSDLALGIQNGDIQTYLLSPLMLFVYAAWCLYICCGMVVRKSCSDRGPILQGLSLLGGSAAGSCGFFLVSNFGVWCLSGWYPRTVAGLGECFTAALPFFRGTIQGDAIYLLGLIGAFAVAKAVTRSDERSAAFVYAD